MAKDLLETMANEPGFKITVYSASPETFEIGANRVRTYLALLLRRQREREGLTLAEAAKRLGQSSRNAYARYEQGKSVPTVEKLEELLAAIAPDQRIVWRFAA
jgi:ribosome-binding protein aMBF1 (putative translation factor)